jgi:hypothetical protein
LNIKSLISEECSNYEFRTIDLNVKDNFKFVKIKEECIPEIRQPIKEPVITVKEAIKETVKETVKEPVITVKESVKEIEVQTPLVSVKENLHKELKSNHRKH